MHPKPGKWLTPRPFRAHVLTPWRPPVLTPWGLGSGTELVPPPPAPWGACGCWHVLMGIAAYGGGR